MTERLPMITEAHVEGYCPSCGKRLDPPCIVCGVGTRTSGGVASHVANHRASPDSGRCTVCGLETKRRANLIGHVFDHPAVTE